MSEAMSQDEDHQGESEDYNIDSYLDVSKNTKNESYLTHSGKRGSKHRTQRYRTAWETDPDFASWIQPVENDTLSATCTICSTIMRAEVTVLKRHCVSAKHVKRSQLSEKGESTPSLVFTFKEAWEKHKDYKHWIGRVPEDDSKAYCVVCQVQLNANLSNLKQHNRSASHQSKLLLSEDDFNNTTDHEEHDKDNSDDDGPKYSTVTVNRCDDLNNIKFTDLRIQEDNEEPAESHNSETPYKVFRVKPTRPTSTPYTSSAGGKLPTVEEEMSCQAIVTQTAPSWKGKAVVNGHVREISLSDYKGRYLVMFFYPQDFSTVCSTEILALGDVLSAFRVINCEIVAVSVDSHLAHLAWTKTLTGSSGGSRPAIDASRIVPLLSDSTHSISKTYGCYQPSVGHSLRAYYIIDKRGCLRAMSVSDIQVGRNLKEILRLVEAFQLVDSTDTQCPVNWTTGQPSVKVAL
uniref:thioredoxin-dependent peroxiredoxin n=1 Tax=Cacopsylla melanoneura TaxID=428564 RepID=A0A8D9BVE9_9HEMI